MERVTLQTIADAVGVSRTTASNAFSRPDQLNAELRRRILSVAEELGYPGPNAAARTLRRGRAGVIGVLFTENLSYAFADPYAVGFLRGLATAAERDGTSLQLIAWPSDDSAEELVADAVVDGFCVYSMPDGHPTVAAALRRRLPIVVVDGPYLPDVPFVGVDARQAGRELAAHVLGLGHRRIAVLAAWLYHRARPGWAQLEDGDGHPFGITRALLEGYRDACRGATVDWDAVPLYQEGNSREAGRRAAAHLLDLPDRPTAILATTDQLALGAIEAATERGLRVPEDLSVVGFDDIPAAGPAGLTTVRQPRDDKGRTAGELLLHPTDSHPAARTIMPHTLVVRTSTAPPPSRP